MSRTYRTLTVEPERCCGCRSCELACSFFHFKECNPSRSFIKIVKFEDKGIDVPIVCQQCETPFCKEACPIGAIQVEKSSGAFVINRSLCAGCKACVTSCPFGAIHLDTKTREIVKCDLCDGAPRCVEVCPMEALKFEKMEISSKSRMRHFCERTMKLHSGASKGFQGLKFVRYKETSPSGTPET